MPMQSRRISGWFGWLATASLVAVLSFSLGRKLSPTVESPEAPPPAGVAVGRHLLVVYVGASTCGPSNDPALPSLWKEAVDSIRSVATRRGVSVRTIGIAREYSVAAGLSHLEKLGELDEVNVGQRELALGSLRYIALDHSGVPATPQIVLLERELPALGNTVDPSALKERLLVRRVGLRDVANWIALGVPVPATRDRPRFRG